MAKVAQGILMANVDPVHTVKRKLPGSLLEITVTQKENVFVAPKENLTSAVIQAAVTTTHWCGQIILMVNDLT